MFPGLRRLALLAAPPVHAAAAAKARAAKPAGPLLIAALLEGWIRKNTR